MQYVDYMDDDPAFSWLTVLLPIGWFVALALVSAYIPRRARVPLWYSLHLLGAVWLWSVSPLEPTFKHFIALAVVAGLSGGIGGEILKVD